MSELTSNPGLAHHFEDLEQQHESMTLGMWAFLITEVMFFGGLFTLYAIYRWQYPDAFSESSNKLSVLQGAGNTVVLIGSSLTMALSIWRAQHGDMRGTVRYLVATLLLGSVFLVVKGFEYSHKFHDHLVPGAHFDVSQFLMPETQAHGALFFSLYFAMTGMHALHMVIGMVALLILIKRVRRGRYSAENYSALELMGLYWHFVDIVWIFLFPLLYLIGRTWTPA